MSSGWRIAREMYLRGGCRCVLISFNVYELYALAEDGANNIDFSLMFVGPAHLSMGDLDTQESRSDNTKSKN